MKLALFLFLASRAFAQMMGAIVGDVHHGGAPPTTVTYDNSSNGTPCLTTCTSTTYDTTVTVGSGSNRQAIAVPIVGCSGIQSAPTIVSVVDTTDSITLTAVSPSYTNSPSAARSVTPYMFPAGSVPSTGSVTFRATLSGAPNSGCNANATVYFPVVTMANVNQTTALTTSQGNAQTSTTSTVTLGSSGANDLVVQFVCAGSALSSPTGTSTISNNGSDNNSCGDMAVSRTTGGTTTMTATIAGSDSFISVALSVKP